MQNILFKISAVILILIICVPLQSADKPQVNVDKKGVAIKGYDPGMARPGYLPMVSISNCSNRVRKNTLLPTAVTVPTPWPRAVGWTSIPGPGKLSKGSSISTSA